MIIICWHSCGFLLNIRQPQDNSHLFLSNYRLRRKRYIFLIFTPIFNIKYDIHFH